MSCMFIASSPFKEWMGRYDRIPGDQSVFHIRWDSQRGRFWPLAERSSDAWTETYWFEDHAVIEELTASVNEIKQRLNGQSGGSFTINEWGQVLVPAGGDERRIFYAGQLEGTWYLREPDGRLVCLADSAGLRGGDPWDLPYVGQPYHLSARGRVYFVRETLGERKPDYPIAQDQKLIRALRKVRRWGAVRFIVNPFGVVLTKRPVVGVNEEDFWEPVFVERLDYTKWFAREEP